MSIRLIAPLTASALAWALFAGCSSPEPEAEPVEATETTGAALPDEVFADDAASVELSDEEVELIRQLPEADAEIALAQKVCPVSGEHLGTESMGVPVKVDVEGTPVFICCAGCKGSVLDNPDAILAKVPQGKADAPEAEAEAPEGEGS